MRCLDKTLIKNSSVYGHKNGKFGGLKGHLTNADLFKNCKIFNLNFTRGFFVTKELELIQM